MHIQTIAHVSAVYNVLFQEWIHHVAETWRLLNSSKDKISLLAKINSEKPVLRMKSNRFLLTESQNIEEQCKALNSELMGC